ncbi:hypothetical protein PV773_12365 [Mesorhizobium sp. CC13]|uniref:hypothetical protein n=1 Tax=Mesorhizobium sp. CC13 TaxID=3029194 RepID=UPI003263255F
MKKFFILFEARSGSSHLVSLLNSSPQVTCYSEIYTAQSAEVADQLTKAFVEGRPLHTINRWALDDHRSIDVEKAPHVMGFKTKIYDIPEPDRTLRQLHNAGATMILLTRTNVLKQAVSRAAGLALYQRSRLYNANSSDETVRSVTVDPDDVIAFAEVYNANQVALKVRYEDWTRPKLAITYEQLLADEIAVVGCVRSLLGLAPFESRSQVSKNLDDSLQSAVANYDELAAALKGHPYSRFL